MPSTAGRRPDPPHLAPPRPPIRSIPASLWRTTHFPAPLAPRIPSLRSDPSLAASCALPQPTPWLGFWARLRRRRGSSDSGIKEIE